MNLIKPLHITLVGSVFLGLMVFITLLVVELLTQIDISKITYSVIPIISTILSFVIFTYFIDRFINKKIRHIYSIIDTGQISQEPDIKLSDDSLGQLTNATAEWSEAQKKQISDLKKQADFRKEFLGNLAHELKTPIFSIEGYILTLLEGGLEDERVNRDFLERALNGVDRISNLVEDLDQISKLETDRFDLVIAKFDLVKLINDVFQELEPRANTRSIKLKFDKHYEPLFVKADKNSITRVFVNLISNSISYGNTGGITQIKIELIEKRKVSISVIDNGLGMAKEHIPRLFERFYRVDKSRERNIGGSGLGLAIVKHIVEAHKQTIVVKSTEGVGSTFTLTLDKA